VWCMSSKAVVKVGTTAPRTYKTGQRYLLRPAPAGDGRYVAIESCPTKAGRYKMRFFLPCSP
jgi:hypothetical protein